MWCCHAGAVGAGVKGVERSAHSCSGRTQRENVNARRRNIDLGAPIREVGDVVVVVSGGHRDDLWQVRWIVVPGVIVVISSGGYDDRAEVVGVADRIRDGL